MPPIDPIRIESNFIETNDSSARYFGENLPLKEEKKNFHSGKKDIEH